WPARMLSVGAKRLAGPASGSAMRGRIGKGQMRKSQQEVGHIVPAGKILESPEIGEHPESILKGIGHDVHLVGTKLATHPDVVLAANHVKRIGDMEHVRSTLERSESAVTQRPVGASYDRRS